MENLSRGLRQAGAAGALIGASFLPTSLDAQENVDLSNTTLPAAAAPQETEQSEQPERITGLTLEDHGSTFEEGSEVAVIHKRLQEQMQNGTGVAQSEVASIFAALQHESETEVTPGFLKQYFKQFRADEVSVEFLKFISTSDYMGGSLESIGPYLEYENTQVKALALEVLYQNRTVKFSREKLTPFLEHEDTKVRAGAFLLGATRFLDVKPSEISDLVIASSKLRSYDLMTGHKIIFGQRLKQILGDACDIDNMEMATLQALEQLEGIAPGYLASLTPRQVNDLCQSLVTGLKQERERLDKVIVLEPGMDILLALHEEEPFKREVIDEYAERFGATVRAVFKGKQSYDDMSAKEAYLNEVKLLSAETETKHLIWNLMHGSPDGFWFDSGTPGQTSDMDEAKQYAVSPEEFAKALVTPHLEQEQIDLSHISILLEACQQYTVATGLQDEILKLAKEHDKEVVGLPAMVAISQSQMIGQVSEIIQTSEVREYDPRYRGYVIREVENSHIKGRLQINLESILDEEAEQITLHDILKAQELIGERLPGHINSPEVKTELQNRVEALLTSPEMKVFLASEQDPAVFSPVMTEFKTFLNRCIQRAEKKGKPGSFPRPEVDQPLEGRRALLLELGHMHRDVPGGWLQA